MARVIVNESGAIYRIDSSDVATAVALPAGVYSVSGRRPCSVKYKNGFFMAGPWSQPLTFTQDGKVWPMGMIAPTSPITIATGASSIPISVTGDVFAYATFVEKLPNGTVIAESNPNEQSNTLTSPGGPIVYSGIPTYSPSPRATHVRMYRSDGGTLPKLDVEVALGTTTISSRVSTAALAGRTALPNFDDSLTLERGIPPYARFIASYHDRVWFAGNPVYPGRLYYSKLFEPEGVGASSFVDTRDGEAITAVQRVADQLLIFTRRACYSLQGYSALGPTADIRLAKASPNIGCISHHACVNINDRLWFPSEQGVYCFDTTFRFVMKDLRSYWKDAFTDDQDTFLKCVAEDDHENMVYKLLIPYEEGSFSFVANYEYFDPAVGGGQDQPRWSFDTRAREDTAMGKMFKVGNKVSLYTGSADGYVREENVDTDTTDDSDTDGKLTEIVSKHFYFDDPGGSSEDGKTLKGLWSYVQGENNDWEVRVYSGYETAYETDSEAHTFIDKLTPTESPGKVPKTVHHHNRPNKCSGHGFTMVWLAPGGSDWRFRGFGGYYGPGPGYRGNSA